MADLCNYLSEIDMDGRMFGGEHLGSLLRSPERRGESCIRPLCLICPYAGVNQSAICPSPSQEQESQGMVSEG
uniref:Uncharacterized protein n=1 Tax=Candidatus Kentrum sp. FM TaxID=2126340 RepID=A0A450T199_9GAMM|nr:MAG: hypothetical protein BECKFM1743A_GA0114220_102604 [Candidatus Kentron sp. FM]VFJ67591.1 MAG: hypothetical protein BECKFM1743C_GA0114222_104595 [Candidatus Kentron sp. FM]VFK12212.1 MAG: hypothetical protein BECKFM1743B_GA0114221_102294 [Candidatus Kentron sp. FM]